MVTRPCPTCGGKRLRPEVLAVTIDGRNISDVSTLSITDALRLGRRRSPRSSPSASGRSPARSLKEIVARLGFLVDVGLDYLTLDRTSRDPVGRRGPADPPGDPDRDDADGRPVHPRRAVDRAPPARQREAHRDPHPAARPRQHGPRRRARRGDDPDGGLGHRHRARGGGARRRDHRQRAARGASSPSRARSPAPSCAASGPSPIPAQRRQGQRQDARRHGAPASTTCSGIDVRVPARARSWP